MSKFRLYEEHQDIYQIQEWVHQPPTTYRPTVINEGTWNWKTLLVLENVNEAYAREEFGKIVRKLIRARNFEPRVVKEVEYE